MKTEAVKRQRGRPFYNEYAIQRGVFFIKHLGLGIMFATTMLMAWTFMTAYASPTFTTMIHINNYGEANVEFIMLMLAIPISLASIFIILNEKNNTALD